MNTYRTLCGTAAILVAWAGTATADVTGADIWANWQAIAEGTGQTFSAESTSQDGPVLTLGNLQMSMMFPDGSVLGTIEEVQFRDIDGGKVEITMSPSYEMVVSVSPEDGESADMVLVVDQTGLNMVASGDPDAIDYEITAEAMAVNIDNVIVDGEELEMTVDIAMSDLGGTYSFEGGEMSTIVSSLTAATAAFGVEASEPGGDGTFAMAVELADVAVDSNSVLATMASQSMSELLASGMEGGGKMTHGAASYALAFNEGSDSFELLASADTGGFEASVDEKALAYSFGNTGLEVSVSGSEIPFPELKAAVEEYVFGLAMPVSASKKPEDFAVELTLAGLTVSDMLWGMVDPGGVLPRDPATLMIDVAGKANWFFNILDPEAAEAMTTQVPGEIHELTLNGLTVAVAGAELTGNGGFMFDNTDLQTFGGMPKPTGSVDLQLIGGNGLIDKLVQMGLVPQDQAMAARMMMGLFAKPGEGDDTLVSTIEVTEDGGITANGQRLQ